MSGCGHPLDRGHRRHHRSAAVPLAGLGLRQRCRFINNNLFAYCAERQITFTRGRPYRKNDSCYVEQKNWSVVRQAVGYTRFDSDAEVAVLVELYRHLRLLINFFVPQAKLMTKTRDGARVTRRYDAPATPYARVLASGVLSKPQAAALTDLQRSLNPAQLRRDISFNQRRLAELVRDQRSA